MSLKKLSFILFILSLFLVSSSIAGTVNYFYDELNRLIRAEYPDGSYIEYTYDAVGNRLSKVIDVVDTIPPELSVSVSLDTLWPPNHKLVTINADISLIDMCESEPKVELVSIISNEPDEGTGDGDKPNDIQEANYGTDDRKFKLRAERQGSGDGRVYTITYKAYDDCGNTATQQATVIVPHDKSNKKK